MGEPQRYAPRQQSRSVRKEGDDPEGRQGYEIPFCHQIASEPEQRVHHRRSQGDECNGQGSSLSADHADRSGRPDRRKEEEGEQREGIQHRGRIHDQPVCAKSLCTRQGQAGKEVDVLEEVGRKVDLIHLMCLGYNRVWNGRSVAHDEQGHLQPDAGNPDSTGFQGMARRW